MNEEQRKALLAAKLRALVKNRWGDAATSGAPGRFPGGATLRSGQQGWVLVGDDGANRLGGALAWARQAGVEDLHVVADDEGAAGLLARRASYFARPARVWRVDGRELQPAVAANWPERLVPPPDAELLRLMLLDAGLEVVAEADELIGEVRGLEVARVRSDQVGASDQPPARLEVGIGRFDREAFALMNPDLADAEALAKAAAIVRLHRRAGAPRHPLNQLVPERWLRSVVVAEPSLVGARTLVPAESSEPRRNLRETSTATATGVDQHGHELVVVCSAGVDLELVPRAAEDRAWLAPEAELLLAVPNRDSVPVTRALAASLTRPARVVPLPDNWRELDTA